MDMKATTRRSSVRTLIKALGSLAFLAVLAYAFGHGFGWIPTLIALAVLTVISTVVVLWSRRNETVALVAAIEIPRDDERQALIRLKASALAGRVSFLVGTVYFMIYVVANLLSDGEITAPPPGGFVGAGTLEQAFTAAGTIAISIGTYAVTLTVALWHYDRRI